MRRLFRSFERAHLDYLLINGQATVLYGAAMFSEDVDIWIPPTKKNASSLLQALGSCGARLHRLTPPLTVRNMRAGHGFHFIIPDNPLEAYLDVMGRPPRVGSFSAAKRRARIMRTDWGEIPVVDPMDLVELKKTRRLADYDIITNLVVLQVAEAPKPTTTLLSWAASNCFRAEERAALLARLGRKVSIETCARQISKEVRLLQAKDRVYWSKVIDELRTMHREKTLLPDGAPVAALATKVEKRR